MNALPISRVQKTAIDLLRRHGSSPRRQRQLVGRLMSSSTNDPPRFQLPNPTWSVKDLELSKQHKPISEEELKILARRALLDVENMEPDRREQLKQDLGNMMHMINQVSSFKYEDNNHLDEISIYDKPRGVSEAPLRDDIPDNDIELKEAKEVWETLLKSKTTKVGAHDYFRIQTK